MFQTVVGSAFQHQHACGFDGFHALSFESTAQCSRFMVQWFVNVGTFEPFRRKCWMTQLKLRSWQRPSCAEQLIWSRMCSGVSWHICRYIWIHNASSVLTHEKFCAASSYTVVDFKTKHYTIMISLLHLIEHSAHPDDTFHLHARVLKSNPMNRCDVFDLGTAAWGWLVNSNV